MATKVLHSLTFAYFFSDIFSVSPHTNGANFFLILEQTKLFLALLSIFSWGFSQLAPFFLSVFRDDMVP